MEAVLLSIQMDPERAMRLSMIALSLGVRFRPVLEEECELPLSALLGGPGEGRGMKAPPVMEPMIVMAHFSDAQVDALLRAVKESGMRPIRLKAVLTDTNRSWSCGMLYAALSRESAYFSKNAAKA